MLSEIEVKTADDAVVVLNGALAQIPSELFDEFKAEVIKKFSALDGSTKPTPVELVGAALNLSDDAAHLAGDSPSAVKAQHILDVISSGYETFLEGKFNLFNAISAWIQIKKASK